MSRLWSAQPLHVALYEPEIPGNAGNVARLCAATESPLHLIGRLGFSFSHPEAKRAAMDYWDSISVHRHVNYADFLAATAHQSLWLLTTRAEQTLWDVEFGEGDVLLFGPESRGLPDDLLAAHADRVVRIPMRGSARSLNLGTAVGVTLYEAIRQTETRAANPPEYGGRSDRNATETQP